MTAAKDIIERSIQMHPTFFAETLRAQEIMHKGYQAVATDPRAKQGAAASERACERAREWIGRQDLSEGERAACICAECGTMVIALNVACKLQCLPAHVRTAAAVEWDEAQS